VKINRRFGESYRFHLQGIRVSQKINQQEALLASFFLLVYYLSYSSAMKMQVNMALLAACFLLVCMLGLFGTEDGGSTSLRNICELLSK
jgi:hypothetical protein